MESNSKKDIAIIGISGKFPKSNNIEEFWTNLIKGNELFKHYSDEELSNLGIAKNHIKNPNYIKVESRIDNPETFDFSFFGYTPDEAALMDPQIRLFHEHTWLALEDAGYNSFSYDGKIGLFASASDNLNWRMNVILSNNDNVSPYFLNQVSNKNFLSTLVSYKLNLKGPSYFIDTACSSSLSAVHLACRNLLLRECNMAVAGGVSLSTTTNIGYHFKEGLINSKDGHCRAFDSKSSGTISGEGIGIVILKRLSDAIDSGDNIYAIIKSSAVNNDGKNKIGYTAPSIGGQVDCIKTALSAAKISPSSISYIETHGTGTKLGDAIEIEALNNVFEKYKNDECTIGAVKNNLGHLDAAAGITGLIKTTLALKHRIIPPTINYSQPNPEVNFKNGPFKVNTKLIEWKSTNQNRLRAGVSSFGIGGTNAHVILEENKIIKDINHARNYKLLRFSARSLRSLESYSSDFLNYLKNNKGLNISDVAYTLQKGRKNFEYRKFLVCENSNDAISQLKEKNTSKIKSEKLVTKNAIVFMFPGQGSQYFNMCYDIYKEEPFFRSIMDEGFEVLKNLTGENYREILYQESNKTHLKIEKVNETIYAQPLLFLTEYSFARLLMNWGIIPDYIIGHSIGEYSAACLSGVFSYKEALTLIYNRATLINSIEKGSMLAVSASKTVILPYLTDELSLAAINSPEMTVISGTLMGIKELIKKLKAKKIAHIKLAASHAFHSSMIDAINNEFKKELKKIHYSDMKIPIVSNLSGEFVSNKQMRSGKYWIEHLRNTVDFSSGIKFLLKKKNTLFIEVGPGRTLTNLVKQNNQPKSLNIKTINTIRSHNYFINDNRKLLLALGELWTGGFDINWDEYYRNEIRHRVSAPTYCFDEHIFPVRVDPIEQFKNINFKRNIRDVRSISDWFYLPLWKKSFISNKIEATNSSEIFLIFSDKNKLSLELTEKLLAEGKKVIVAHKGNSFKKHGDFSYEINPLENNDYKLLHDKIVNKIKFIDQIIYCWGLSDSEVDIDKYDFESRFTVINSVFFSLLWIYQNFNIQKYEKYIKIILLSNLNHEILYDEQLNYNVATASSLLTISAQENPNIFACQIDVNIEDEYYNLSSKILDELLYNDVNSMVGYRGGQRYTREYDNIKLPLFTNKSKVKNQGTYIITGGLGKVGLAFTEYLIEKYNTNVIILGRTKLPNKSNWDDTINNKKGNLKIIEKIKVLKQYTNNVIYQECDISNYDALLKIVKCTEEKFNKIDGIIHAAGVTDRNTFKIIENINEKIVKDQFIPKMNGLINLYRIFNSKEIDFVWITSSLSSIIGGLTYTPYAAANGFMDSFVNSKKNEIPNWYCINLDAISKENINAIGLEDLMEIFERSFSVGNNSQLIISVRDLLSEKEIQDQRSIKSVVTGSISSDRPDLIVKYKKPTTAIEKTLQKIWQDFFRMEKIGIQDDFFDLGGDSLKAITILKRISKTFKIEIEIYSFYDKPNIVNMAKEIDSILNIIAMEEKKKSNSNLNELKV